MQTTCKATFDRGAAKRPRMVACTRTDAGHAVHWQKVGGKKMRSSRLVTWTDEMEGAKNL